MTVGVGFTVILKSISDPWQEEDPDIVGVTVIVEVMGAFVELVAVNGGMLPGPEVGLIPISGGLLADQVKVVPLRAPLKLIDWTV